NIRVTLLAALDRWSAIVGTPDRADWIVDVASRAEPEPTAWRKDARSRGLYRNRAMLLSLVERARVEEESVALLLALGTRLNYIKKRPLDSKAPDVSKRTLTPEDKLQISFLTKVQQAHPDDFRANNGLGRALLDGNKPDEAVRYFQA